MKYSSKRKISLLLIAVMSLKKKDRGLHLNEFNSRCFSVGEIHEVMVANDWDGNRNKILNNISYIGFFSFENGGVIEVGDSLVNSDNKKVGTVIGFEGTHLPNHMNIVLESSSKLSGTERGFLASQSFEIPEYKK